MCTWQTLASVYAVVGEPRGALLPLLGGTAAQAPLKIPDLQHQKGESNDKGEIGRLTSMYILYVKSIYTYYMYYMYIYG